MSSCYPLLMAPHYRHGEQTPWGGSALRAFGKQTPDERTGESLEVSALPGMASMVRNGELEGKPLSDVIELWGELLTGPIGPGFPLLLKLIDAREMLSLQVHPSDAYAFEHEGGKRGKTEAWVILSAPHGARLVYGVNCGKAELKEAIDQGRLEGALRQVQVAPGDVLYIPCGMVHALGSGIMVYEIQQSSDVTYRFWDWGRVGADGRARELHMDKAFEVTDAGLKLDKLGGATLLCEGGSRTAFISDENFELWRLNVAGNMPLPSGRMLMLTPLDACKLFWAGGELGLNPLDTVLVPAALSGASVRGNLPVLMSTTPDQATLRRQLGVRADAVAGL